MDTKGYENLRVNNREDLSHKASFFSSNTRQGNFKVILTHIITFCGTFKPNMPKYNLSTLFKWTNLWSNLKDN